VLVGSKRTTCNYVQNRRCDHPLSSIVDSLEIARAILNYNSHYIISGMVLVVMSVGKSVQRKKTLACVYVSLAFTWIGHNVCK